MEAALERQRISYKEFLLVTEDERPLYYRASDSIMTAYGAICFLTSVLEPEIATRYHFTELEDVINVSFFVKFLLLFWSNDWSTSWLFTGKAVLDLASCLPVISIPVRFMGAPSMEEYINLLQIARFLRLLEEASAPQTKGKELPVPLEQQLVSVLLSLLGTMAISAAVLFLYENTPTATRPRTFEDCLLYMVNLFAGRDLPWMPQQALGKMVSAAATCLSIVFIPFLVSRTVELFMTKSGMQELAPAPAGLVGVGSVAAETGSGGLVARPLLPAAEAQTTPSAGPLVSASRAAPVAAAAPSGAGAKFWAAAVARLDRLVASKLLSLEDARQLRRRCLLRDPQVEILELCYSRRTADSIYAGRLREMLDDEQDLGRSS